jgi:hypothetical protein
MVGRTTPIRKRRRWLEAHGSDPSVGEKPPVGASRPWTSGHLRRSFLFCRCRRGGGLRMASDRPGVSSWGEPKARGEAPGPGFGAEPHREGDGGAKRRKGSRYEERR